MRKKNLLVICMMLTISISSIFPIQIAIAARPILSNPFPSANNDALYNPQLRITVYDEDNDNLTVIFRTNASGVWETLGNYSGGNKIYTQNTTGMDEKNIKYFWSANVSDGINWENRTYSFIAQPFVLKWTYTANANTSIGPLAVDINNDGIYEVFATGNNTAYCVNGSTGALIWQYFNSEIIYHSPFELGDLNYDGIPEMVISGRETTINQGKTIALHANDGTVYWIANAESGGKYLGIADVDGNHFPYVFICSGDYFHGVNGYGRLRKLRGTDGFVLQEKFLYRPCWGGISIADADNDGKIEIYVNERRANYDSYQKLPNGTKIPISLGQLNLGMMCYDAETLDLLWYQDAITCSSHTISLFDVNNDNVLDAVALQQNGGGIFVVDGATWDKMPGYWKNGMSRFPAHSNIPIYDIDEDGKVEIITASEGPAQMWELGIWDNYSLIGTSDYNEPPKMADVIGDEKLEIIGVSTGAKIYDPNGNLIETIPGCFGIDTPLIQDIDNDGRNELIVMVGTGQLRCYDTLAYAPTPRVRTNNQHYSEQRSGVGVYVPPPGAPQPIIKTISPLDHAQDVPLNPMLCAKIIDYHHDLMNITISTNATGSWTTLAQFFDVENGWYNVSTIPLDIMNQKNTTYYWRVTAYDPYADKLTTSETFSFTTHAPPLISNIVATPYEVLPGEYVNISCEVTDGTVINTVKINITAPNGQHTNTTASGGSPGWTVLKYDDFESGMGSYTDGGSACTRATNATYSHQGTRSMLIQDYLGLDSSFYLTQPIDVDTPRYTSIKIDFWFKAHNMSNLSNFWVKFYDGQHWRIVDNYIKPGAQGYRPTDKPFENDTFYHAITWINESKYTFPTNMKIRFECDGVGSSNMVYIDQVYINATTAQGTNYFLNKNTYTIPGIYEYYIWANDQSGNNIKSASKTFKIAGNQQPTLGTPNPADGSTDNYLNFIWTIPIMDADGDEITWNIECSNGQSNSSTGDSSGTKSVALNGLAYATTYKVWVNATDPNGSGNFTRKWYTFSTIAANQPPIFGTPSPKNGSTDNALSLIWKIPINDPDADVFDWSIQCSNGQSNNYTGDSNGIKSLNLSGLTYSKTYTIWVNATDPTGSNQVTNKWYTITPKSSSGGSSGGGSGGQPPAPENKKPIANTSYGEPYQGYVDTAIHFDGSNSYDPDGNITTWFWEFGDTKNGTGTKINHTYSKPGTYIVTLTVTDNEGAHNTDTTTCQISQPNRPPTQPIITGPTTGTKNTIYTYIAQSTDEDNDTLQYTVDCNDPLSQPETSEFIPNGSTYTIHHSWTTAGRYEINVKVTDNKTETSATMMVYINAIPIDNLGYLLDNDNDTIYDAFYSDTEKQIFSIQMQDDNYDIDTDGDGIWDYTFNLTNGLTEFEPPTTPGFELIILLTSLIIIISWKRKRKYQK